MPNIAEAIVNEVNNRKANPFIASFALSFVFINWRAFIVIPFKDEAVIGPLAVSRTTFIEHYFSETSLSTSLGLPILYMILIVGISLLSKWAYFHLDDLLRVRSEYRASVRAKDLEERKKYRKTAEDAFLEACSVLAYAKILVEKMDHYGNNEIQYSKSKVIEGIAKISQYVDIIKIGGYIDVPSKTQIFAKKFTDLKERVSKKIPIDAIKFKS